MRAPLDRPLFALSFGFVLLILATQNAHAQNAPSPQCAPRPAVLEALANGFGEARRAVGIAGQAHVMELFVNPETGTWTITATRPDGVMCLIASGSNFEQVQGSAPAKGSPA